MSRLRLGVSVGHDLADLDHEARRRRLVDWADAGIDHLLIADHVSFRGGSGTDALVHLAHLSGLEPRLGLFAGVMLLALRHPMVAARQLATLAELAPGRLTLGVGVGGEDRHEFEVCGVDPRTRGRRTDSALEIVRRVLDGEAVDWDDEFFSLTDARIRPIPEPRLPVVVGGRSDAAVERAGRLGDGWLAAWCSPRRFREGVERAEAAAEAAGRSVAWQHGLQVWVGVGTDPAEARGRVAAGMEAFYRIPFDAFEKYTPMGAADDIADFLAPYVEAGARVLNLSTVGPDAETEQATMAEVARLLRPLAGTSPAD